MGVNVRGRLNGIIGRFGWVIERVFSGNFGRKAKRMGLPADAMFFIPLLNH